MATTATYILPHTQKAHYFSLIYSATPNFCMQLHLNYAPNMHQNCTINHSSMHTSLSQLYRALSIFSIPLPHFQQSAYYHLYLLRLGTSSPDYIRALEAPRTYLSCPYACKKSKTTTPRIPMWSPTMVLTRRYSAWLRRSDGMRYFLSPMAVDTRMFKVWLYTWNCNVR